MFSNRKVRWLFACALILTPLAFGVEESTQMQGQAMKEKVKSAIAEGAILARGTTVIGHEVQNAQGEKIGTIHDLVLDERGDKVIYAVLSHGGVGGVGNKMFAVPWNEYSIRAVGAETGEKPAMGLIGDKERKFTITLNVTKDTLNKSIGFKENEWPAQAQARFEERQAAKIEPLKGKVLRLSKLFGEEVTSERGTEAAAKERIGQLKDVALAVRVGRPVYGEITLAHIKGKEDFHSLVPWSALKFERTAQETVQVALNVPDAKTLEEFAFKPGTEVPGLSERGYAARLYAAYNQQPDFEMLGFISPEAKARIEERRMEHPPAAAP